MRMIYFMITSSFLIVLMLLVRSVFRKKLSPGMIYALWLIPLLRFMIPFGFVEVPVFGQMAELLNPSFAITREIEMETVGSDYEKADVFNEYVPIEETKQEHNGIKVYDSALEMEPVEDGALDTTEEVFAEQVTDEKNSVKWIAVTVWISGAVLLSVYVIALNCRLQKKVNELEVIEQADGRNILLSREVKTPCLVGVRNPRILIPETVLKDGKLYEYAIRHELAHFYQKDHLWNVIRIFMCVVYWWNPFVWYGAKCAAEDAELACDERVLKNKTAQERKDYGYALLSMMENAQNSPLCMATSYFGGKNTAKQRIESIARKTTTKKYVLIPVVLLLVMFCAVGCIYPSDESNTKTNDLMQGETEELTDNEAKGEPPEILPVEEYFETYSENVEVSLAGNTSNATKIIKESEERSRAGYKEAALTYVDNAKVRWDYYTDNPWAFNAERDALAQAALKELYTLTGYQVEECTYTTDGRSRFIFGKNAEYIKKNIAFYSRDYGFQLCGDNVPFIGFMNARKVHYSDVQQLDSPFDNDKIKGLEQVSQWFLERSGLYQGEMITGYEKINLDDTVYTHVRMNFDGGYYIVVMDEKIESIHEVMGPYME